jgi:hypothetical protein
MSFDGLASKHTYIIFYNAIVLFLSSFNVFKTQCYNTFSSKNETLVALIIYIFFIKALITSFHDVFKVFTFIFSKHGNKHLVIIASPLLFHQQLKFPQ